MNTPISLEGAPTDNRNGGTEFQDQMKNFDKTIFNQIKNQLKREDEINNAQRWNEEGVKLRSKPNEGGVDTDTNNQLSIRCHLEAIKIDQAKGISNPYAWNQIGTALSLSRNYDQAIKVFQFSKNLEVKDDSGNIDANFTAQQKATAFQEMGKAFLERSEITGNVDIKNIKAAIDCFDEVIEATRGFTDNAKKTETIDAAKKYKEEVIKQNKEFFKGEIKILEDSIKNIKVELENASTDIEKCKKEIKEIRECLDNFNPKILEKLNDLEGRVNELENKLEEQRREREEKLVDNYLEKYGEIDKNITDLSETLEKAENIKRDEDIIVANIIDKNIENVLTGDDNLNEIIDKQKAEKKIQETDREIILKKIVKNEADIKTANDKIESQSLKNKKNYVNKWKSAETSNLDAELTSIGLSISDSEARLQHYQNRPQPSPTSIFDAEKIKELTEKIKEQKAQQTILKEIEKIKTAETEMTQNKKALNETIVEIKKQEKEIKNNEKLRKEIKNTKSPLTEKQIENNKAVKDAEDKLGKEIKRLKFLKVKINNSIKELKEELAELMKETSGEENTTDKEKRKDQIEYLKGQIDKLESVKDNIANKIEDLAPEEKLKNIDIMKNLLNGNFKENIATLFKNFKDIEKIDLTEYGKDKSSDENIERKVQNNLMEIIKIFGHGLTEEEKNYLDNIKEKIKNTKNIKGIVSYLKKSEEIQKEEEKIKGANNRIDNNILKSLSINSALISFETKDQAKNFKEGLDKKVFEILEERNIAVKKKWGESGPDELKNLKNYEDFIKKEKEARKVDLESFLTTELEKNEFEKSNDEIERLAELYIEKYDNDLRKEELKEEKKENYTEMLDVMGVENPAEVSEYFVQLETHLGNSSTPDEFFESIKNDESGMFPDAIQDIEKITDPEEKVKAKSKFFENAKALGACGALLGGVAGGAAGGFLMMIILGLIKEFKGGK